MTDDEANEKQGILVVGRNKKDIARQMEKLNFDPELLKKVTLYQCTHEEVQSSRDDIEKLENERKAKDQMKPGDMWLQDLDEFVKVYCKHYKTEYTSPKKILLKVVE